MPAPFAASAQMWCTVFKPKRPPLFSGGTKPIKAISFTNEVDRHDSVSFLIRKDHCGSDQPVLTLPTSVPSPSAKWGGELVELPSGELINRHMGRTSRPTPCPSLVVTGAAGQEEVDIRVC